MTVEKSLHSWCTRFWYLSCLVQAKSLVSPVSWAAAIVTMTYDSLAGQVSSGMLFMGSQERWPGWLKKALVEIFQNQFSSPKQLSSLLSSG